MSAQQSSADASSDLSDLRYHMRHSAAHVMAEAVMKVLWPHLIGQDALQPEAVTERLHQ